MFTNREIRHYTDLLQNLNQEDETPLPEGYLLILSEGGKDGIPHFKLLFNTQTITYVIWVRGTDFADANDVFINIRTKPIKFYEGCCHSGYFIAANEIINLITGHITQQKVNKIICLGHSLGGSVSSVIATIFHKFESDLNKTISEVKSKNGIFAIIYGTPPTFSANICKETQKFIINIILKKDIVPKLGGMFNSLMHLQNQNVTNSLYLQNCIQNDLKDKDQKTTQNIFMPEYLPGKVVVLNPSENTIIIHPGSNKTENAKYSEITGVFHHAFSNYYNAISTFISNNDNSFYEDNVVAPNG